MQLYEEPSSFLHITLMLSAFFLLPMTSWKKRKHSSTVTFSKVRGTPSFSSSMASQDSTHAISYVGVFLAPEGAKHTLKILAPSLNPGGYSIVDFLTRADVQASMLDSSRFGGIRFPVANFRNHSSTFSRTTVVRSISRSVGNQILIKKKKN